MPYQNFKSEMAGSCLIDFSPVLKGVFVYRLANQSGEIEYNLIIEGKEGTIRASDSIPTGLECFSRKLGTGWQKVEWDCYETTLAGHTASMAELINAIHENREPSNSAQDNLNSVRISLAMHRSLKEDRPVYLKELWAK
jgi:predicted dehydrogenase